MEMAHTAMALQASWSRLRPMIQKAIPWLGGTHDEADLLADVMQGRVTFWPGRNAFVIAAVEQYPKLKRLNFILSGGDQDEADQIGIRVVGWAKLMGATQMTVQVRPGVDRLVRHGARDGHGADRSRVIYMRAI